MNTRIGLFGAICWLAFMATAHAAKGELQQLIDQTPEHGVIRLEDKTYTGNIVIEKPITIQGKKQTVVAGDGMGNVITIKAPHVQLENLAVTHSSLSRNEDEEFSAIRVMSDGNRLRNLRISDAYHGVSLYYSRHNELSNLTITGQGGEEIAGQGNGIQLIHSEDNRLRDIQITATRDGIYYYYAPRNVTERCEVSKTRYGLHFMYSDENQFLQNRFSRNTGGAAIMHSRGLILQENEFAFHQGTRSFGLMLQASDDNKISQNRFIQNQRALYLDQAQRNRLQDNQFLHNEVGMEIWASSADQVIAGNRFYKNTAAVLQMGGISRNQWAEEGRGNDWGNELPLLDLNQDGIGDEPVVYHSSLHRIVAEHELAYLFLQSPAIKLYEKWQKMLQDSESIVTDPYPLVKGQQDRWSMWLLFVSMAAIAGRVLWRRRKRA